MHSGVWWLALAAGLVTPPLAAADWAPEVIGGGRVPLGRHEDRVDPATMAAWKREAQATIARLGLQLPARPKADSMLRHPLQLTPGIASTTRIGIANFVDRDAGFPDRLRDYQCGERTYDTSGGYNHAGIDYFLWPFGWQSMAQETVAAVAAAPGTIVRRVDGHPDRNCSFDSSTPPNSVWVAHDSGGLGVYLHFKRGSVTPRQVGERVAAGDFLGWIGSSGISTGPHLHFELHASADINSAVVDPNQGQCSVEPSRWERQPAYREPRLEMVGVHDAAPEFFFPSCSDNEQPHFAQVFVPGQSLIVAGYYADQPAGRESSIVVRGPDGSELQRFVHAPTAANLGGDDAYDASYWFFNFTVPAQAPPGLYSAEISYEGVTRKRFFAVGGSIYRASGVWYDPAQSGHGFTSEVVQLDGRAHLAVVWFAHLDGAVRWMSGLGEIIDGGATVPLQISRGGSFPPAFAASQVDFDDWGVARFSFDTDDSGRVEWSSSYPGFNDGAMTLTRLVDVADENADTDLTGMRACASGSWYVPSQSGHGLQLQVTDVGGQRLLLATWYVYHQGEQFWLSGIGPIDGKRAVLTLERSRGGDFPPAFDPSTVVSETWGTATIDFVDPLNLSLSWQASQPGFENGSLQLSRLTELLTAPCL